MQEDTLMMDSNRPSSGGSSKTPLIAGFALLFIAIAAAWFVFSKGMLPSPIGKPAIKKVASIDSEAVYQLKEFTEAEKKLSDLLKQKEDEFKKYLEGNPKPSEQAARLKYEEMQLALQQEKNKIFNPLQSRAEAAVALVAREQGFTVVLDKRIVVFGVKDITEDVKKAFQTSGEIKLPKEQDTSDSPIAYFDQEVVRSLKAFQEVDLQLMQLRRELQEEIEKKVAENRNMSQPEAETLQKSAMLRYEARKEQLQAPLLQNVTESVQEVSKTENLALVLNKQHVMYGGRNITDEVVEAFLKKAGGASEPSAPASESTPKAP